VDGGLLARCRRDPLVATSGALMLTTATTAGLGVAFWAVASHLYAPGQLGQDVAIVSAMILLSTVSQLNLGMGLARFLPQICDRPWRPVLLSYAVAAVMAVVVTIGFVVVAPAVSSSFAFVGHDHRLAIALVVGVVLWNVFALQDAVLTSARWAGVLPIENGIFGLLKIALLVLLASLLAAHGIFYAWLFGMALMLIPVNIIIFTKALPSLSQHARPSAAGVLPVSDRPRVARYLLTDYLAALLSQGYKSLLPLLVLAALGSTANAYFYTAFLVAGAVGELSLSLGTSLVVEGAHGEAGVALLAKRSVLLYARFVVPGVIALAAAAPLILRPFGAAYVAHGTTLLRLLLAGTLPQAVITLYLGVERVRAQVSRVIVAEAAVVALVTCGGVVGMRWYGLNGIGAAWLLGQTAVAVAVAPFLWRACVPPNDNRLGALT
jgi:O-antigen/teichoic acid export membrane protein